MARAATTSDVFNAVADVHRRQILDTLRAGERDVGALVSALSMSQPQVSKHLRVLDQVGLVACRPEGRRRVYRLAPERLRPLHEWVAQYEQLLDARLDRMGAYLATLQSPAEPQPQGDTS